MNVFERGERAVNILSWRLDRRRDFPDFVPFSNFFFLRLELYSVSFPVFIWGRGRGRGVKTGEEKEGKQLTTLEERNHASGCCLLRSQVTQNEELLQEHFIRAHPAQKGKTKHERVSMCVTLCVLLPSYFL